MMTADEKDRELAESIASALKEIDELEGLQPKDPADYNVDVILDRIKRAKGCTCRE